LFKKVFNIADEQGTINLAQQLANITHKRDVFALYGTLGAGKSVFSRAFIKSLVDVDDVPSPTFTLLQTYPYNDTDIYHYDLYRLQNPEEIYELGLEEAIYNGICLIEWPEKAGNLLPRDIFKVEITPLNNQRIFTITVNSTEKAQRLEQINVN